MSFQMGCIFRNNLRLSKRASRLALADAVRHQLETGLGLLGITVPERM